MQPDECPTPLSNPFLPGVFDPPPHVDDREPDPADPDGLSPAERVAVEAVADGARPTVAVVEAGYARTMSTPLFQRPPVRAALRGALERRGLGDDAVARVLHEGLEATSPVVYRGEVVGREPDHATRHKYLHTLLTVRGDLRPEPAEGETWESVLVAVRRASTPGPGGRTGDLDR